MDKKIIIMVLVSAFVLFGGAVILQSTVSLEAPESLRTQSVTEKNLEVFLAENKASEEIKAAYRFALANPEDILLKVKCYCGCLEQDHKNSRDCFINKDGTFDLMGLNCGLCVKTALLSKNMLAEGKTVQEISDYVDARWGDRKGVL